MITTRRSVALLATLLSFACSADTPTGTTPPPPLPPPPAFGPVFVDGQAQVVPEFSDSTQWIRQELWVETTFDADGNGLPDRMHVDVTRPGQSGTGGVKVAIIYASSPYYAGVSGTNANNWDVRQELGAPSPPRIRQPAITYKPVRPVISTSLVASWVPRGFAVVHSDAPGTGLSQGCPTMSDSPEGLGGKAVVDWLNGRAKGYTTATGATEVVATSWSTGKVGMIGTSYEGTIPLETALTGVVGLEAIIPVSPATSFYHYYRANGLVRHPGGYLGEDIDMFYDYVNSGDPAFRPYCDATYRDGLFAAWQDRMGGDYNDMWAARDQLPLVGNIRAAVLFAHGFNDWNVMPAQTIRMWQALKNRLPSAKLYMHQRGHGGNPPSDIINKWWSHYLYGVNNGVELLPRAMIVNSLAPSGAPDSYSDWPLPGSAPVTVYPTAGGATMGGLTVAATSGQGSETLTDNAVLFGNALAAAASSPNRLIYATPILAQAVHLSGTTTVTLRIASGKAAVNLSVWMVTLPFDAASTGVVLAPAGLITRGWADPQNFAALTGSGNFNSKAPGVPLVPGAFYNLTFDLEPDDQVIPAGKRIAVMIMASDRDFTLAPSAGTTLTVELNGTSFVLPVVGGLTSWREAGGN